MSVSHVVPEYVREPARELVPRAFLLGDARRARLVEPTPLGVVSLMSHHSLRPDVASAPDVT
ncbi:MAG: hypothetical protein ACI364_03885 [Coriobacteriales bacterium]